MSSKNFVDIFVHISNINKIEYMFYNLLIPQKKRGVCMGIKAMLVQMINDTDDEELLKYIYLIILKIKGKH